MWKHHVSNTARTYRENKITRNVTICVRYVNMCFLCCWGMPCKMLRNILFVKLGRRRRKKRKKMVYKKTRNIQKKNVKETLSASFTGYEVTFSGNNRASIMVNIAPYILHDWLTKYLYSIFDIRSFDSDILFILSCLLLSLLSFMSFLYLLLVRCVIQPILQLIRLMMSEKIRATSNKIYLRLWNTV